MRRIASLLTAALVVALAAAAPASGAEEITTTELFERAAKAYQGLETYCEETAFQKGILHGSEGQSEEGRLRVSFRRGGVVHDVQVGRAHGCEELIEKLLAEEPPGAPEASAP